jgi:hypothetical protein
MLRATALLPLCLLLACGGGSRPAAPGPSGGDSGAAEHQILDRFKTLDDRVEQTRSRCDELAAGVDAWMASNAEEVGGLIERSRAEPGLEGAELARVEDTLERIFDRVLDALGSCKGQGGADAVHARLDAWLEAT